MSDDIVTILTTLDRAAAAWLRMLLDATIKATVLIALVGIAARFCQRSSAAARHLVWLIVLAMLPLLPVLYVTLTGWHILPDLTPSSLQSEMPQSIDTTITHVHNVPFTDALPSFDVTPTSAITDVPVTRPSRPGASAARWSTMLFTVWAVGCVATLLPWLGGVVSLWRVRRSSMHIDDGPLAALLKQLTAELQIRRPVELLTSHERQMPMQWGVRRPHVLLPAAAVNWPMARLRAVLLHELAHVRRLDCLTQSAATFVRAMYWFHPLVSWTVGRMKAEGELACDDQVLTAGCGATEYAEHLLHVAAHSGGASPPTAAIAMARPTGLERRIGSILDRARRRGPVTVVGTLASFVVLATATVALSALRVETSSSATLDTHAHAQVAHSDGVPITLGHVDDTAEGRRSIAGSGHAVRFDRPADTDRLVAVEIFASRYGHADPPAEDFHVYVLDEDHRLLHAAPFPYAMIERNAARWYSLKLLAVDVPDRFVVALAFNPHRTKGVYLGFDENVEQSHSLVGRPTTGYEPLTGNRDWMIRAVVAPDAPLNNPFETVDSR